MKIERAGNGRFETAERRAARFETVEQRTARFETAERRAGRFETVQRGTAALLCARTVLIALILTACVALGGAAARAATKPTINSFSASPTSIIRGQSSTLSWDTTGATKISIVPGTFTSTAASGSTSVSPTTTTTYTLKATNSAGTVTKTAKVIVTVPQKPMIHSFKASPPKILDGTSSTLAWDTTDATSIAISPGGFSSGSAMGSVSVSPTATTAYKLTATNANGSKTATLTVTVVTPAQLKINSFTAKPAIIMAGTSTSLKWSTAGTTSVSITPGTFTSTLSNGSTSVSPGATTTYTLTATNGVASKTATATVTVTSGAVLSITTSSCPSGVQYKTYAGCTIEATGGTPPYNFSATKSPSYASLPEGMALNPATGAVSSALIGGQGTYGVQFVVTDSSPTQETANVLISFAIQGNNAFLASIFPANSIFHHRVDAATTGLPVDTSPAAPIYSGYQSETIKAFFGDADYLNIPNGIPAIEVPYNQADVAVKTLLYQSYFTSAPIPAYAPIEDTANSTPDGQGGCCDMHVLVYVEAGGGNNPALYEMWNAVPQAGGGWNDGSNALWPNANSNQLTPQGNGTSDAAGLPVAPLLLNADEVIGTGTPTAPNGVVMHPVRFTLNHMLDYWVWPATSTAGEGECKNSDGSVIPTATEISESSPPASCEGLSGPAGEIYRLKASVATPACASTNPQSAVIITGFRNYGIILADNGESGGLIGTPDTRWNDTDLQCLESLKLEDFEPVNVSSLIVSPDSGQTP